MRPTHHKLFGSVLAVLGALLAISSSVVAFASVRAIQPGSPQAITSSPFVTAVGSKLYLQGAPWAFTGYDQYQLTSTATGFQCGGAFSDADLANLLNQIKTNSHSTVIRTWFFQSYGGPHNWGQFDRVLSAAASAGLKVIPVLVNQWGDCEPNVAGHNNYKTLAWYQGGYRVAGDNYPLSFRNYAAAVAAHYANNTTIAFWQLVNEAEAMDSASGPCEENSAALAIRAFADDTARVVKSVDRHHLVSLGTIGSGQCGSAWTDFSYIHSGAIDLCEYHDYAAGAMPGDPWNGLALRISQCQALGKPIFSGEMGVDASVQPDWSATGVVTATSLAQRATFFREKMSAQFGAGSSGFLIWMKSLVPSQGFDVGPGDPTEPLMQTAQAWVSSHA